MKKNVIRITESELKNYIRKIVSEQTAPATNAIVEKIKNELGGKTVDLFTDFAKTKKQTQFRMDSFEVTTVDGLPKLVITGTDYNHFNEFNQKINSPNAMRIMELHVTCSAKVFTSIPMNSEGTKAHSASIGLNNDSLLEKVKSLLNCGAYQRRKEVDFVASAKSNKPADFA
jgi:hypothetical protein